MHRLKRQLLFVWHNIASHIVPESYVPLLLAFTLTSRVTNLAFVDILYSLHTLFVLLWVCIILYHTFCLSFYIHFQSIVYCPDWPRPGSVVAERSPGMREVGGSIPGRVKQKTLKFEVLLLCLALSTKDLETVWPARSQNNGLGWDITAYPWDGVSVG